MQALVYREKIVKPTIAPSPRFVVRLNGDIRISATESMNPAAPLTPTSRKARALIAILATAVDRLVSRERIIGLLWSERGEDQARASLRQALAEVRRLPYADWIQISRRDIRLTPGIFETDVDRIIARADSGDMPGLAAALADIESGFLADLEGLDPGFDDWLHIERERQRGRLVSAAMAAVRRATDPASLGHRRIILAALQQVDAGDEAIVRLGLALDQEAGDIAAVHRRYRQFQATVRRDYDANPSSETQALFRQLTAVGPVTATPVAMPAPAAAPRIERAADGTQRNEPPIIVLSSFTTMGGGGEAETVAQIIHDDLQTALGGFRDLRVLSVDDPSPERLAAACAGSIASYALGGTAREQDGGYRVNLRITALDTGILVWSRQIAVQADTLGSVIDELVARIAGAILPVVVRDIGQALDATTGRTPASSSLYFGARARLLASSSLAEVREAAELFEKVIEEDPSIVNAHLHLARIYNTDFMLRLAGHDPAPLRARAFELSMRAAALDPANGHVHSRLAWCYLRRGDAVQAVRRFEHSVEVGPHHADGLNEAGFGLCHIGLLDRAADLIGRAFELNPFPPDEYFADWGVLAMLRGQHDDAEAQFEISRDPAIHYQAVRCANLALAGYQARAEAQAETLRAAFTPLWHNPAPPTNADIVAGIHIFLPLHLPEHRDLLDKGLRIAGLG
ncbi:trifolitoxin synthesis, TfuA [Sphingomonas sp. KC8]|nr:trifolitoxin synthesis, TfuA [Sphingomonas sp. KC8]